MLYLAQLKVPSYPERNFGGNQLLDSSISLSPLYLDLTSDLHVSIDSNVHQGFPWLPSAQEKFAIFRVLAGVLCFRSFSHTIRTEPHGAQHIFVPSEWDYFHFASGFVTPFDSHTR